MTRLLFSAAVVLSALSTPPAVRVRYSITATEALRPDAARIRAALQHGLYDDSLIVTGADSLFDLKALTRDTAWKLPHGQRVVVVGSVLARGDTLDIQLRMVDILTHPIVDQDTLHVERTQVDSVLTERGRKYARLLAAKHR